MLTQRLQIQAIADRLAGLPVRAHIRHFVEPWASLWRALETSQPGQEQAALETALANLPNHDAALQAILAARPGFRPLVASLADLAQELDPIEWVWPGWIPRGMITVLGASQGSGKSMVVTDLSYRVIHNQGFPDHSPIERPGARIIYVDAEMVPQILNQRAESYGLDRNKLFLLLPEEGEMLDLGLARYQDKLAEMATMLEPELIVIDSLSSAHSGGQNNVEDVRQFMGYLIRLVRYARCGLVLVHHIRKPPGGQQRMMGFDLGMEDLSGSGYITQQARVVLGLRVVQTGPEFDPNGPRELKVLKNNLGPYPKPLGFQFVPMHPAGVTLHWDEQAPTPYRAPTQLDECKEWLEDLLRDADTPLTPQEVIRSGQELGFSRAMIYRARQELGKHILNTSGRKSPDNCWKWSDAPVQPAEDT